MKGIANAEAILKILIQGTEACFEQLRAKGKKTLNDDEIWIGAKRILGCVATLAISTEKLMNVDKEAAFDKVDVKSPIAVGTYAARKKEMSATFDSNDNLKSKYKVSSGVSVSGYENYFAEEGWESPYVVGQMGMLVWNAVGKIKTDQPLTQDEWDELKQDMESHGTRRRDSINYYLPVKEKNENHPLLDINVCQQIKERLPMLSIVHVDVDDIDSVLLIGEGILISLIEEFLSLIDRYK